MKLLMKMVSGERSIYSRPWIDNDSDEIPVTITLKDVGLLKRRLFARLYRRIRSIRFFVLFVRMAKVKMWKYSFIDNPFSLYCKKKRMDYVVFRF